MYGMMTSTLTQDELQGLFSTRVNRTHPTVTAYVQDDTAYDAVQYWTMLDNTIHHLRIVRRGRSA